MAAKPVQSGVAAEPFNPDTYWPAVGPYLAGPGAASAEHIETERLLSELLPRLGRIREVLDVGCGKGRLASLLATVLPDTDYYGVDIGEAQVAATAAVRPDGTVYQSRIQDFESDQQWDLVLTSEVLLHIPPADIQAVCDKLKRLARKWIVAVEWTQALDVPTAEWNWLYNYADLFGEIETEIKTGNQSILVIKR